MPRSSYANSNRYWDTVPQKKLYTKKVAYRESPEKANIVILPTKPDIAGLSYSLDKPTWKRILSTLYHNNFLEIGGLDDKRSGISGITKDRR